MGNLWSVWRPGHGLPHHSRLDELIVERYRDRLDDLNRDAGGIREELLASRPTARAEALAPDAEDVRNEILQALRAQAHDGEGNDIGVHVFERRGTWYVGFFIEAYRILTSDVAIGGYLTAAVAVYKPLEKSISRLMGRIKDTSRFAKDVTARILPDLEQRKHFSGSDLQQIARQLARFEVDPFRFNRKLARAFEKVAPQTMIDTIEAFFHIVAPRDCLRCMIILCAASRRALENSASKK
ncbi:MAG: hypothetical protein L3J97_06080 [Thermoplasmata archaeon]|nr:hypothetical protein [Thermoplasmata archaeon]